MKFKLRDHVNVVPFWGTMILIFACVGFAIFCANGLAQEEQTPAHKGWYDFRNKEFIDRLEQMPRWHYNLAISVDELAEFTATQEKEQERERVPVKMPPPYPPTKAEEPAPVKTWRIPDYMRENLQRDLDDFNKRFEAKVQAYKKELKTRFTEFKDMPDDAILYLEGGFFISRSDFLKLQEELRDKLKQEVKGDDKTTN